MPCALAIAVCAHSAYQPPSTAVCFPFVKGLHGRHANHLSERRTRLNSLSFVSTCASGPVLLRLGCQDSLDHLRHQYPHVIREFYQHNRDKLVGSFVNGEYNHWPRQHISLYCWQKVLWNPDYNVDAALDAFCTRMFGPAAATMRQLLALQTDGWEKSAWPGGRFSAKGIYEASFPPATVEKMRKLFAQAKTAAKDDALVTARLNYYFDGGLKDFFDRTFYPTQNQVTDKPYVAFVTHGGGGQAIKSIESIAQSFKFKKAADPVSVKGKPEGKVIKDLNALGAKLAAAAGRPD